MPPRKYETIGSNPLDMLPGGARGKTKGKSKKAKLAGETPLRAEIREALQQQRKPAATSSVLGRWLKSLFGG